MSHKEHREQVRKDLGYNTGPSAKKCPECVPSEIREGIEKINALLSNDKQIQSSGG